MNTLLYPRRERCKTCRKKLDSCVLKGLYCSYACAGAKPPSSKVSDAPRGCRREVNGKWDFKSKYRSVEDVPQKLRDDPGTNIYSCDYCLFFHVGHSRPMSFQRDKLTRTISNTKTLGSVIQRLRTDKGFTQEQLAKYTKVPVAELSRIEDGEQVVNMAVLLRVIAGLKVNFILQEK